jgi:hypothetical protein
MLVGRSQSVADLRNPNMGPPAPPRTSPPSPHETKHDVNTFESFESFQSEEMPKYYPGDAEEYIIAINSLPAFKPTDPTRPMTFSEIEKVHENSLEHLAIIAPAAIEQLEILWRHSVPC